MNLIYNFFPSKFLKSSKWLPKQLSWPFISFNLESILSIITTMLSKWSFSYIFSSFYINRILTLDIFFNKVKSIGILFFILFASFWLLVRSFVLPLNFKLFAEELSSLSNLNVDFEDFFENLFSLLAIWILLLGMGLGVSVSLSLLFLIYLKIMNYVLNIFLIIWYFRYF